MDLTSVYFNAIHSALILFICIILYFKKTIVLVKCLFVFLKKYFLMFIRTYIYITNFLEEWNF